MNTVAIENFDIKAIENTLFDYHVDALKQSTRTLLQEYVNEGYTLVIGDKIRVDEYNFIISDLYFTSNVLYYSVKALNKWTL